MRLFAALVPPAPAVAELRHAVRELKARPDADALRWTDPASWHLTLAFLGEVPEESTGPLTAALAAETAHHTAARVRLAGGGHFGGRALWAGLRGDTAPLHGLADGVRRAAGDAGVACDARPWVPHLTLALAPGTRRGARGGGADLRGQAAALAPFEGSPWPAAEVLLMSSTGGDGPRTYTTTARWPLHP